MTFPMVAIGGSAAGLTAESEVGSRRGAFLLSMFGLLVGLFAVFGALRVQSKAAGGVAHSRAVLQQIETTLSTLKDAETGQWGYLLTGDVRFLEPYRSAIAMLPNTLDALGRLTADNAVQARRLAAVRTSVKQRIEVIAETIRLQDNGQSAAAVAAVRAGRGKAIMEELRIELAGMRAEEERLLTQHNAQASRASAWMLAAVSAMGALGLLLLWMLRSLMARDTARIRLSEERLATTLASVGDAVIATDSQGLIERMNPVAEKLTGWTLPQARGKPLDQIFRIVNEHTRGTVESPLEKVLRDGQVVGLANHTLLIAKDGTELPIEDSGAPIRGSDGAIAGVVLVFKDATARYAAERQLHESEKRFRTLADNIPQLAWIADAGTEGQVHWFNRNWFEYTGTTLEQMQGAGWHAVHHPDHAERVIQKFAHHVKESLDWEDTFPLRGKNGEYRWFLSRMKCIRDNSGTVVQIFGTNTDITRQRQMEDELRALQIERENLLEAERAARHEAESGNRVKDEFLATLSHELRTPLSVIVGWSRLLLKKFGDANEDLKKGLKIIVTNTMTQSQIISDLLDMSSIVSGKSAFDFKPLDLNELTAHCVASQQLAAAEKGINLVHESDPEPKVVSADLGRLQQVMGNLLTNALKFTPAGGRVTVRQRRTDHAFEVSIEDTGEGISADFLPHVFGRFRQADGSSTRNHGGLGLGLAIVKQIMEMHGGSVRAESAGRGRGARFTIALPFEIGRSHDAGSHAGTLEQSGYWTVDPAKHGIDRFKVVHALVVEDDPFMLDFLVRVLEERGVRALGVRTANAALAALKGEQGLSLTVLISDIGLPSIDGYELIRRVRNELKLSAERLPAVAVTAFGRKEDRERAIEAGFQAHLSKPYEVGKLLMIIHQFGEGLARPTHD